MCKAPKVPKPKEPKKPQFLKNKYLDSFVGISGAVNALKTGRNSLRIPLAGSAPAGGTPAGNANTPPTGGDFRVQPIAPRRRRAGVRDPREQLR